MSFVRPGARAAISRWFEPALSGLLLAILGVKAAVLIGRGDGLGWLALAAAFVAAFWLRAGLMRAFLGRRGEAPGVVVLREGQIGYLGPHTGGVMALDAVVRVEVSVPAPGFGPLWRLTSAEGEVVAIPAGAEGAEAVAAALTALPGFSDVAAVRALGETGYGRRTIWERRGAPPAVSPLSPPQSPGSG